MGVARAVVESHGHTLTNEVVKAGIGRRPLDAWQATVDILGMDRSAQELYDQAEPLLTGRWHEAPLLPGAARLLAHLRAHGVPMALATSTPRATLERKLSNKAALREAFGDRICCGDEVCVCVGVGERECVRVRVLDKSGVGPCWRSLSRRTLKHRPPATPACARHRWPAASPRPTASLRLPAAWVWRPRSAW